MSQGRNIGFGIAAVLAGVAVFGSLRHKEAPPTARTPVSRAEPEAARANSSLDPEQREPAPASAPAGTAASEDPVTARRNDQTFRVNQSSRLVLDEHTRLNMEALFARTEPEQLAAAKQEAVAPLPAAAAAQAADLLDHYDNYQQAQRQAYPPGIAPSTEEAALAELDGLHALRVAHFGPLIARALYGEEEARTRQLIELMRQEKDQSLTLEERAERAQQLNDRRDREDPR